MKMFAHLFSIVAAVCVEDVMDDPGLSLLQHSIHRIQEAEDTLDDLPGPPRPGVAERLTARHGQRRAERQADRGPSDLSPEQLERRRMRRRAKREAKRAAHAAGQSHFNDGGTCGICAAKCTTIFNDEFKECIIRENCNSRLKEDGSAADKRQRRCVRSANLLREPCIHGCECDVDLLGVSKTSKTVSHRAEWARTHQRCRAIPLGSISTCRSIAELAEHSDFAQYDSVKECAQAAVQVGANTFNFNRVSKGIDKCSLRQCDGGDLKAGAAPQEAEEFADHGAWRVFSTLCKHFV